jgi:hypothetical protein
MPGFGELVMDTTKQLPGTVITAVDSPNYMTCSP